jgi:putative ATPase
VSQPKENFFYFPQPNLQPLAFRMRPQKLEDVVGQPHLTEEKGILNRIIKTGTLPSMIFWGPPGSGKTSTALLITKQCGYQMLSISAVASGVKDIKESVRIAEKNLADAKKNGFFYR